MYDSVDTFKAVAYRRDGEERLPRHLQDTYNIGVAAITELDSGVFRIERNDGAPWVARLFPAARPLTAVEGDADILRVVADHGFPAERCVPDAVSSFEGQGVLVTEHIEGRNCRGDDSPAVLHHMGALLGRLHTMPVESGAAIRDAGSWHSLSIDGGSRDADVAHLCTLLVDAERRVPAASRSEFESLRAELAALDTGEDLPRALTHPDFVPANAIKRPAGDIVLVDWTGAGTAPRVCALGLLLSCAGADLELVDAIVSGYRDHVQLEREELDRLPDSVRAFALILAAWGVVYWNAPVAPVISRVAPARRHAAAIAARTREAFAAG
jgi:Ser/Thr protein kinase RdoA (MazF antagonist)